MPLFSWVAGSSSGSVPRPLGDRASIDPRAASFLLACAVVDHTVKLLAFAGARDVLGSAELTFALAAPCTASELLAEVCRRWPALAPWRGAIRVAVNGTYAAADDPVGFGDEVALIPPVAGG